MDELARLEYKSLRATIRERGTVRAITFLVTMIGWAGAYLVALGGGALALFAPLLVLAAGFEVVLQLHLGVERVGRYLQVAFEESPDAREPDETRRAGRPGAGWETAAMAYGQTYPGSGSDALFVPVFAIALLVDVAAVVLTLAFSPRAFHAATAAALVVAHAVFAMRLSAGRKRARRQRAEDLERFRKMLRG